MHSGERAIYTISQAALLAGMHAQTLRQYDRLGLVVPSRTAGRGRRYSARDVSRLREVQHLSQVEGINLAGIKRIMTLEDEVSRLRGRLELLASALNPGQRVFAADPAGDIVAMPRGKRHPGMRLIGSRVSDALVLWSPRGR